MNWMSHWGFIADPKKFTGKTIQSIEIARNEHIATTDTSIIFLFSDGTRGWIIGKNSQGVAIDPSEESMSESLIITPDEYAEYQRAKLAKLQERSRQERARKERQLEELKRELGK